MRMNLMNKQQGFTIPELMIAVSVLAILVVAATPSLLNVSRNSQIRAVATSWHDGLFQARIEAIQRNAQVTFCPGAPSASADWSLILTAVDPSCQTATPFLQYNAGSTLARNIQVALPKNASATYDGTGRMVPLSGNFVARFTINGGTCVASGGPMRCLSVEATGGYARTCDPSAAATSPLSCKAGG